MTRERRSRNCQGSSLDAWPLRHHIDVRCRQLFAQPAVGYDRCLGIAMAISSAAEARASVPRQNRHAGSRKTFASRMPNKTLWESLDFPFGEPGAGRNKITCFGDDLQAGLAGFLELGRSHLVPGHHLLEVLPVAQQSALEDL